MEFGVWDPLLHPLPSLPTGQSFPQPQSGRKLRQESAEQELRSLKRCSGALLMLCAPSLPNIPTLGHKTPLDGD